MVKRIRAQHEERLDDLLGDGARQTMEEIAFWDRTFRGAASGQIQLAALRRIATPRAMLLDRFTSSIQAYGLNLRREVQARLALHLAQRSKWRDMSLDVAGRLHSHAITGSRWRAERIVRTELVNALNADHARPIR